ncbi:MAG: guanylate kinase [Gammaproteobacteria bacterium]
MTHSGTLYVVAAASGTGKTSLTQALVQRLPNIGISVSFTTRTQRPGEIQGVHYWFVSLAEFQTMIANDAFLEYAQVFGNYYGTSKQWVEQQLQTSQDVILEIDWQGARQVRLLFPEAVSIFILPPSVALLRERLQKRQQDQAQVIETRLAGSPAEISHFKEFDYLVVNDAFEEALRDLEAVVRATRLKQPRQTVKWRGLLEELLEMH